MKRHFVTIVGADNREVLLRRTLKACYPYFDEFHIFDNGSIDATKDLKASFSKLNYVRTDPGPVGKLVSEAVQSIPKGDWFFFSDSDEQPSAICVPLLEELENLGFQAYWFFGILHNAEPKEPFADTRIKDEAEQFHHNPNMFIGQEHRFRKPMFFKATDNLWVESTGQHYYIKVGDGSTTCHPLHNLTYNHIKTRGTWGLSSVFHGMFDPEHHSVPKVGEWRKLMEEYGMGDFGRLQQMVLERKWPEPVKAWIRENQENPTVREWARVILASKLPVIESYTCGRRCCKYGERQF